VASTRQLANGVLVRDATSTISVRVVSMFSVTRQPAGGFVLRDAGARIDQRAQVGRLARTAKAEATVHLAGLVAEQAAVDVGVVEAKADR
jgi:hypothetical protein